MNLTVQQLQEWMTAHYPELYDFPNSLKYWLNKYDEENPDEGGLELLEFNGEMLTVNIRLSEDEIARLQDVWLNKLHSCQAPLVSVAKNMFTAIIPWIRKEAADGEA